MRMSAHAQHFEVVLAHLDGYVRVKLRGDLDYEATTTYAEALQEITDLRTRVVLDLAELHFIDSAGISFLVRLAQIHEGPLRLMNAPAAVARVLVLTGLAEVFDLDVE
jgi:anti-anti-sigma factor